MELTLSKNYSWYAQVGAFVTLAVAGCGTVFYYYEMPAHADMAARETQLAAPRPQQGPHHGEEAAEFRAPRVKITISKGGWPI